MEYDLIIIGCGSAGTEAAKEALKYTKKVLCIEKTPEDIGGTCLNKGCVPTKFLREGATLVEKINSAGFYGIEASIGGINLIEAISSGKEKVIKPVRDGLYKYLKGKGVKFHFAKGVKFTDNQTVKTTDGKTFKGKYFLIATGSSPSKVPNVEPDGEFILDTNSFWDLRQTPRRVLIVGGGVSGVEFAHILKNYGVEEVFVVELAKEILPTVNFPRDMVKRLERKLKAEGIKILTSTVVEEINRSTGEVKLSNGDTLKVDRVLLTVGRRPNTAGLNLEGIGVALNTRGYVEVDGNYRSSVENIYAAGDVIPTPALAHVAKHEAICAVRNIFRTDRVNPCSLDYTNIPSVVYSAYELGGFGYGDRELKELGYRFKPVMLNFRSVAKALAEGEEGLIKVFLSEKGYILGGFVLSKKHTDSLVHLLLMAKSENWTPEKFRDFVFAHPTVDEVLENLGG